MRYVEAPTCFDANGRALFLAGGITGCPDWQQELAMRLSSLEITLLNPRRRAFDPAAPPATAVEQIEWEHHHLRRADAIAFWFPAESICPIALFELGAWSASDKPLFVGAAPSYPRRLDVVEQLRLARPDVEVVPTLDELAAQVADFFHR